MSAKQTSSAEPAPPPPARKKTPIASVVHDVDHRHLRTYSATDQLKQASAGAVAAAVTRTLTQPLDVLKIRFQLQVEPLRRPTPGSAFSAKYTSIVQAVATIQREEGLRAFWKGHNAGQILSIVNGVAQFWSYEQIHLGLMQMPWLDEHPNATSFLSGSLAGCAATVVSMPFDVIRTRLIAQDHNAAGGYRNILGAFPAIVRAEGVRGLFRGLVSTLLQIGPMVGANFMFYKCFNDFSRRLLDEPPEEQLPTWVLLLTGGAAGVASKSAVYPLDFIKKRLQLQGFEKQRQNYGRNHACTGIMNCIEVTMREEGTWGFYKGMAPTLLKSGLTTALYFAIYERIRQVLLGEGM